LDELKKVKAELRATQEEATEWKMKAEELSFRETEKLKRQDDACVNFLSSVLKPLLVSNGQKSSP
jgi:hypothetical protein